MAAIKEKATETIQAHGGALINREVKGEERESLLAEAEKLQSITIDAWSVSDLELIGIGGFSPLTGFLGEKDYLEVVDHLHLSDGTVWSIPINLAVTEEESTNLTVGETVAFMAKMAFFMAHLISGKNIRMTKPKRQKQYTGQLMMHIQV